MSSPGRTRELFRTAEALREEIESLLLGDLPAEPPVAPALKEAEATVSRFCELGTSNAGIEAIDALRGALGRAAEMLAGAEPGPLRETVEEARACADDLRRKALDVIAASTPVVDASGEVARPFRASVGGPALHEAGDVPPPEILAEARPRDGAPDLGALLAEEDEPPAEAAEVPPDRKQIERLGRDAMEDVAILGGLRRLRDEERWTDGRGFEARLLANLDALWSLDRPIHAEAPRLGVPKALWAYVTEWSFPDWGRAFALAFVLGCASSETALRWVVLAMRRADPSTLEAYIEGLALASNPGIDRAVLAELGSDASAELSAAWLELAERRRLFEASAVLPLLAHPAPRVRIRAARCLRGAPRELCVAALRDLLDDADLEVAAAAADELAARGDARGVEALRRQLSAALVDRDDALGGAAMRGLALVGDPKDEARLVEGALALREGPLWLGWYGRPAHVELVVGELDKARDRGPDGVVRARACERAFERLVGAPAEGADAAELRGRVPPDAPFWKLPRARRGRPHHVREVVAELRDPEARQGDRRVLVRELAGLVPRAPRLDVEGWIARQEAELAAVAEAL